jgi:hypothetical protein
VTRSVDGWTLDCSTSCWMKVWSEGRPGVATSIVLDGDSAYVDFVGDDGGVGSDGWGASTKMTLMALPARAAAGRGEEGGGDGRARRCQSGLSRAADREQRQEHEQICSLVTPCLSRSSSSGSCIARGMSDDG